MSDTFQAPSGQVTSSDEKINHPKHYNMYKGVEIIDLVEQMNFNKGNAVKYITRAGIKDSDTELQDLSKAVWYLEREIQRLKNNSTEGVMSENLCFSTSLFKDGKLLISCAMKAGHEKGFITPRHRATYDGTTYEWTNEQAETNG